MKRNKILTVPSEETVPSRTSGTNIAVAEALEATGICINKPTKTLAA